jgi:hypothetical protein
MSIRLIAKELYRLHREVEKLEETIARSSYLEQEKLKDRLRKLKAEYNRMRRILDGQKDAPPEG